MPALINIVGNKYNELTVIERAENINGRVAWKCLCNCGKYKTIRTGDLTTEHVKNCGNCIDKSTKFEFKDEYVLGTTWQGDKFYIDEDDYDRVKDFDMYRIKKGYVHFRMNGETVPLHRFLMNPKDGELVDHVNRVTYDNRKENLRVCTRGENNRNMPVSKVNTSGYTGVYYRSDRNKWEASIKYNYKNIYLGIFETIEDAVKARLDAEEVYFGEFAPKDKYINNN